ncbi:MULTISPECIES: hypothetical protein [Massilia]|uniref:hypothetical protein n=1 Tax=Massilia TaxID=149698 RepID=UPI001C62FE68|nr:MULTISPECIES: hypothetical protein [Massilia]QYG01215.1 hypothetical protein KY496_23260 [Massilia sp. NP310]
MIDFRLLATVALSVSSIASAQDVLLTGHVQRVILQPSGTEGCPPPCPVVERRPDGSQTVCISNASGCQMMDVKIDRVYRGVASGETRRFRSRIGEWGPSFPVTEKRIVVNEEGGSVSWSPAIERDGKILIDPTRLRRIGGVPTSPDGGSEPVVLDEVLARNHAAH